MSWARVFNIRECNCAEPWEATLHHRGRGDSDAVSEVTKTHDMLDGEEDASSQWLATVQ